MKNMRTKWVFAGAVLVALSLGSCTQKDQVVNTNVTPTDPIPTPSTNELYVYYGAPTDATNAQTLDAMWEKATKLSVTATVPNPAPPKLFQGYWGKSYNVDMRAICDTIGGMMYFLYEWNDPDKSFVQAPYYYDTTSSVHAWKKESSSPTYDTTSGVMTRWAFNEDKFGVLWNISSPAFDQQSCYGTCHTYYSTAAINSGTGNHWTSNYLEKIDQWHLYMMRGSVYNQCSDEFQDDGYSGSGYTPSTTNGRHADMIGNATAALAPGNNQQSLKMSNKTSATMTVPMWIYLHPTGNQVYYILDKDTGGVNTDCVFINSVDSMGVLSYSATRGGTVLGTIDPTDRSNAANAKYWQQPYNTPGLPPPSAFPGIIVGPYQLGRADVGAYYFHDGSRWHLILKRKMKTDDVLKQDVDFSDRTDKKFGIGVFNNANNQHAICPGLVLKFSK